MPEYSATKLANVSLLVSLAHALAGTGITSNAVRPGIILTGGLDTMFDQMGLPKDAAERAKTATGPVGRAGQPQKIADAVAFQ